MGEWLEKWLLERKPIDLQVSAKLRPHRYGVEYQTYKDGAIDFLELLRLAERSPVCTLGWAIGSYQLWAQEEEYLASQIHSAAEYEYADDGGVITMLDDAEGQRGIDLTHYSFTHKWGSYLNSLSIDIRRFHPDYDCTGEHIISLVDKITRWKHPQHLECGPSRYFRDYHPLDRARRGIRWIGWVPFALNPSDVPEAEHVQQMNGGTVIATQMAFWQAFERHPFYSKEAIERAQEVEVRLNLLGVLPTAVELGRGDWGR